MTSTIEPSQQDGSVKPWKTLSSSMALNEKWFPVRKDTVQLPSGKVIDDYFIYESPHIVMVVPVTPDGRFVLVRQYRHGIGKIVCQPPGGAVDKNETLEAAAKREMEEETGYTSNELIHLGTSAPNATKSNTTEDIFIALNVTQGGHKQYDAQEESEVLLMTKEQLLASLDSKEIQMSDMFASMYLALRYLGHM
ncbi:MAG TPA: NUDIX hydrolase [Candidatus Saccharimonadales bacterium]|nr:NUDIX hydrolase [Candidatus Saccharimonadales bacterium]